MDKWSNQTKGTVYCIVGVLLITPDSLLVRKVSHLPDFTVQFFRYFIFTYTISVWFGFQEGRESVAKFKEIGKIGLLAGLIWGASNLLVTMAFQKTAAANALVILASNPTFSALFSFVILKETIPWRTIIAGLVCFGAILLIFASALGSSDGGFEGVIYALLASMSMGMYFVLLRLAGNLGSEPDMMPCNIIAGVFSTFVSACMAPDMSTLQPIDLLYLFLMGAAMLPICFSLLTIGPSLIAAPEVSLYTLIETVLGPVWVWLGGYEAPPISAVYGGVMLITALAVHSFIAMKEEKERLLLILAKEQLEQDQENQSIEIDNSSTKVSDKYYGSERGENGEEDKKSSKKVSNVLRYMSTNNDVNSLL